MSVFQDYLKEGTAALGLTLSITQSNNFELYKDLLLEWNKKFNLTAITDEKEIAIKHFVDSLVLLIYGSFGEGMKLLDVGTGAGFPGLPLKIMLPRLEVCLLDSLQKRVGFLEEVIRQTGLEKVTALHGRAEDMAHKTGLRESFPRVTARAVARLNILLEYSLPFVEPGGLFIALKGPEAQAEVKESAEALVTLGGKVKDLISMELPLSGGTRSLIIIEKTGRTPVKYPRKAGTPEKKPL